MLRSLRIALRTLFRRKSFALMATLTLGIGIGATAAIFTVVKSVVLDSLPYPAPEELVRVQHRVTRLNPEWRWGVSEAGFFAFRESSERLTDLAAYDIWDMVLGGDDVAERVSVAAVSANLFELLGAEPVAGRLLRWEDNAQRTATVIVLGHEIWREQFGADPRVIGTTVTLEGNPLEVVGVLEPGFDLPESHPDVWLPVYISPTKQPVNWHRFNVIGRLGPGATAAGVEEELNTLIAGFGERLPAAYGNNFVEDAGFSAEVLPLQKAVVGGASTALWVLMAAVAIVLLIGCVNVANLFLVRMEGARRETAIRTALGASKGALVRMWLSESVLLAAGAALVGLLLAGWGIELLVRLAPDLPRLDEVALDGDAILFTVGIALAAALVFGMLPVVRARARFEWLREGVGMTASRRRHAVRHGLVILEMALALVLLSGAGLMLRTFQNLRAVDPGIDPEGVLTVEVSLPYASYATDAATLGFYRTLTERIAALPGVTAVGATTSLPLAYPNPTGANCATLFTDDVPARERMAGCFASPVRVTPGYFEAMGIEVDGPSPTWGDMEARRGNVVVTRALAEHVWPAGDAVGKGIRGNGMAEPYYRIEAITEDVRANGVDQPGIPRVYFPMVALENAPLWQSPTGMTVAVRTAGRPEPLAAPIQGLIRDIDPGAAIGQVRPMTDVVAASMGRTSFALLMLAIAASVALGLGVIGLYGVISYVVEQRRSEIGIRMALGARAPEVRRMVVVEAAWLAGAGVLVGSVVALAATGALASQLYGVEARDPVTLVAVAVVLLAVALTAAYVPARRASRVEPMTVLRGE